MSSYANFRLNHVYHSITSERLINPLLRPLNNYSSKKIRNYFISNPSTISSIFLYLIQINIHNSVKHITAIFTIMHQYENNARHPTVKGQTYPLKNLMQKIRILFQLRWKIFEVDKIDYTCMLACLCGLQNTKHF